MAEIEETNIETTEDEPNFRFDPVLPEDDESEDDEPEQQAAPKPKPTRRKRRNSKRAPSPEDPQEDQQLSPQKKAAQSAIMDFDDYMTTYDWDIPGHYSKLVRLEPGMWKGVATSGELARKEGAPFSTQEIRETYGGGLYEARIFGPRDPGAAHALQLGSKRVRIPGAPNLNIQTVEVQQNQAAAPPQDGFTNLAGSAQNQILGFMTKQVDRQIDDYKDQVKELKQQLTSRSDDAPASAFIVDRIEKTAEERIKALTEASQKETAELHRQNTELRQKLDRLESESERKVSEASSAANNMLTNLVPHISGTAQTQIQQILQQTDQQLARQETQHKSDLDNIHRFYQTQINNLQTMFQSQLSSEKASAGNQSTLLQGEIQILRAKVEHLEKENNKLREQHMQSLMQQIADKDPIKKMEELSLLKDVASAFGGGGGSEDDLGDASPMLKVINNALPMLGNVAEAVKARFTGPQAPMPPQHPQAPQQMPQGLPRPQGTQGPQPRQLQQRPQPQRRVTKVSKEDMKHAVGLLDGAARGGTPPQQAAKAACRAIDNAMLKEIAKRPAEVILNNLRRENMLEGTALAREPEGPLYLDAFLGFLRQELGLAPKTELPPPAAEATTKELPQSHTLPSEDPT